MEYDKETYKIWNWKSPVVLHWIINPGAVIGDLFLGITLPKVLLIKRESNEPLYNRTVIPCPHCETLHNGLKWSSLNKTATGNWWGLYCDSCEGIIPVQRNLTSLIILFLTFPIWGWFRSSLKQNWLKKQPERFRNIKLEISPKAHSTKYLLTFGIVMGIIFSLLMTLIIPWIQGQEITQRSILIGIPLWLTAGLLTVYSINKMMNKKGDKSTATNTL